MKPIEVPHRIQPDIWERLSEQARLVISAVEDMAPSALPCGEEYLASLIYFGCAEPVFNGALALLSIDPNELSQSMMELTIPADETAVNAMPQANPLLAQHYAAFWASVARLSAETEVDCSMLTERLLVSDYLGEGAKALANKYGLDASILRKRSFALDPELRIGSEPPIGRILVPDALPAPVGRDEVIAVARDRFLYGQHTLLHGASGVGKSVIARNAGGRSGRLAVWLTASDVVCIATDERATRLGELTSWLRLTNAGLVLTGFAHNTRIWPADFALDRNIPLLATSDIARWPSTLGKGRRGTKLAIPTPTVDETRQIMAAWADEPKRPQLLPGAIEVASDYAARYFTQYGGGVPGATARLLKRVAIEAEERGDTTPMVDISGVEHAASTLSGLPLAVISEAERKRLASLPDRLRAHVVGQDGAIDTIVAAVRRRAVQLGESRKAMGSFVFVGPTGVGKTELARALATVYFGSERKLHRYDMGEFQHSHEIMKLLGAPPSYVGHDGAGRLVTDLTESPEAVLLFDEIEKAHPAIFDLLLGMMDSGQVIGSKGEVLKLDRTIIIMTSNLGAKPEAWRTKGSIGFGADQSDIATRLAEARAAAVRDHFRPEFIGRLDAIVYFNALVHASMRQIIDLDIARKIGAARRGGIVLEVSEELREAMTARAIEAGMGGRAALREVGTYVEDLLAVQLLAEGHHPGVGYLVDVDRSGSKLTTRREPLRRRAA